MAQSEPGPCRLLDSDPPHQPVGRLLDHRQLKFGRNSVAEWPEISSLVLPTSYREKEGVTRNFPPRLKPAATEGMQKTFLSINQHEKSYSIEVQSWQMPQFGVQNFVFRSIFRFGLPRVEAKNWAILGQEKPSIQGLTKNCLLIEKLKISFFLARNYALEKS